MTKRTRLLLAGAVVVLFALIPGSAAANTVADLQGGDAGCEKGEAPTSASY